MVENDTPVSDRDRGFCTAGQLDYLRGRKELTGSRERQTRYRIRQRAAGAIRELGLLLDELDGDERAAIQETESLDALAFLIQPDVRDFMTATEPGDRKGTFFQKYLGFFLADAIERALKVDEPGVSYDIEVNVEITEKEPESPSVDELKQQFKNGEIEAEALVDYYAKEKISLREFCQLPAEVLVWMIDEATDEDGEWLDSVRDTTDMADIPSTAREREGIYDE